MILSHPKNLFPHTESPMYFLFTVSAVTAYPVTAAVLAVQVPLPELTDPWSIHGITHPLMVGPWKVEKQVYQKATEFHQKYCSTLAAVKLFRKQQQSRLGTRMKPNSHWNTLTSEAVIRWTVPCSSTHRARWCSMSIQRMSQLCQALQLLASKNTAFSMLVVVLHSPPLQKSTEHLFWINWNQ